MGRPIVAGVPKVIELGHLGSLRCEVLGVQLPATEIVSCPNNCHKTSMVEGHGEHTREGWEAARHSPQGRSSGVIVAAAGG